MNFSYTSTKVFLPEELRTAFNDFLQEQVATEGPERQVEMLFNTEPEQLSFHFEVPKQ